MNDMTNSLVRYQTPLTSSIVREPLDRSQHIRENSILAQKPNKVLDFIWNFPTPNNPPKRVIWSGSGGESEGVFQSRLNSKFFV